VRDLIDVITPDLVTERDWFETEHLTTVAVIVLRFGLEKGKPKFTAFMLAPKPTAAASKKIQEELTGLSGSAGAGGGKDEDEEYLPYVQLAMSPLATSD